MREPGLCRSDQAQGNARALPPREFTHDVRGETFRRKLVWVWEVNCRRQQWKGPDIGGTDCLNDGKVQYRRIQTTCSIDVSDRAVGCAEVNSDEEVAHGTLWIIVAYITPSSLDSSRVSTAQAHLFPDTE